MEAAGSTEFRRSKVVKASKETDITDKIEEEQVSVGQLVSFSRFFQAKKGPKKAWAALSKDDSAMLVGEDEPMENDWMLEKKINPKKLKKKRREKRPLFCLN